ncbi:MAG: DUF1810 domain-containing protein [Acidobacteriota bacterium]
MHDPYDLLRFVTAQEPAISGVLAELKAGRKRTHWIWFVFPQVYGLGSSGMAQRFAISSKAEAQAYLAHPVLGPRLRQCVELVNGVEGRTANGIFGYPDDLKFRSSMTLFAQSAQDNQVFLDALQKYYGGEMDPLTLAKL